MERTEGFPARVLANGQHLVKRLCPGKVHALTSQYKDILA